MHPYPQRSAEAARKAKLAQVHLALPQIGMDDDAYRDLLHVKFGVQSAKGLTIAQLDELLAHFTRLGFKARPPKRAAGKITPTAAENPKVGMARGLWLELADMGAVRNRAESALNAYVNRQTGVAHISWLSEAQVNTVIESLKQWRVRAQAGRVLASMDKLVTALEARV